MKAQDYLLITNQVLGSNSKVHQTALHKPLILVNDDAIDYSIRPIWN